VTPLDVFKARGIYDAFVATAPFGVATQHRKMRIQPGRMELIEDRDSVAALEASPPLIRM